MDFYNLLNDENPAQYLDDEKKVEYFTDAKMEKSFNIPEKSDERHSYDENMEYSARKENPEYFSHEENLGYSLHGLNPEYSLMHNECQKYSANAEYDRNEDYSDDVNLDYSLGSKTPEHTRHVEGHDECMKYLSQEKKLLYFQDSGYQPRDDNAQYSSHNDALEYSPPGKDLECVSDDEASENSLFGTKLDYSENFNSLHDTDIKRQIPNYEGLGHSSDGRNPEYSSHDDGENDAPPAEDNSKLLSHLESLVYTQNDKNIGFYSDDEVSNSSYTSSKNYRPEYGLYSTDYENIEYPSDDSSIQYSTGDENDDSDDEVWESTSDNEDEENGIFEENANSEDGKDADYISNNENVDFRTNGKNPGYAPDEGLEYTPSNENIEYTRNEKDEEKYAKDDEEYTPNFDMVYPTDNETEQYYPSQANPEYPSHENLESSIEVKNQEYGLYPRYLVSCPKDLNLIYIRLDESFKQCIEREYKKYFPYDTNHAYFQAFDAGKSRPSVIPQTNGREESAPRKLRLKQEHPLLEGVKKILDASKIDYDREVLSRLTIIAERMSTKLLQDAIYYSPAKVDDDSEKTGLNTEDIKFAIKMEYSHEVNVPDEDTRIYAAADINCNPLSNLIPNETLLPEQNLGNANYKLKDKERDPTDTILRLFTRGLKRPMVENPVTIHTIPKVMRKIIITPNFGTVIVPRESLQESTTMQRDLLP